MYCSHVALLIAAVLVRATKRLRSDFHVRFFAVYDRASAGGNAGVTTTPPSALCLFVFFCMFVGVVCLCCLFFVFFLISILTVHGAGMRDIANSKFFVYSLSPSGSTLSVNTSSLVIPNHQHTFLPVSPHPPTRIVTAHCLHTGSL